jgi:exosortase
MSLSYIRNPQDQAARGRICNRRDKNTDNRTFVMPRDILFLFFSLMVITFFYGPFSELMSLSFKSELYSHIVLIPMVSGFFIYSRRKVLFSEVSTSYFPGAAIIAFGIILYVIGRDQAAGLTQNDYLALMIFSAVMIWIGGWVLLYGVRSFRVAAFPLLFLFFLTPIPGHVVETFICLLQAGSAEITHLFFRLAGVPVLREGFTFHLSGLSIGVAKECSGIRSSIALLITSIIAGQFYLHSNWKRLILVLSIFPVTVFKNGLRIVTLSLLGAYVDPRILGSELHKSGGIPFFIVALLLLAPVLWILKRTEKEDKKRTLAKGPGL